jgi:1-acyl-sn-glycerol-3-phosphate acyltransferase
VDPSSIKQVLRLIQNGKKVAIFPQGTRKPEPTIEDGTAKEGVAMFAIRTGTPVVPMMFDRKIKAFRVLSIIQSVHRFVQYRRSIL